MDATLIGLIIGIILAVITILLILWGNKSDKARVENQRMADVISKSNAAALLPDDLLIIEGIGPKIAAVLQEKGISTFSQLASASVADLEKILQENHLQFAKPGSWPEQARLAAAGKMDELKALQEKLVAGR